MTPAERAAAQRAAIRDLAALMPADRYELLRPETLATIERITRYEGQGRVTNRRLDMRLKENRT